MSDGDRLSDVPAGGRGPGPADLPADPAQPVRATVPGRAILPARRDLDVEVRVPGSKSITNRALLLAALAGGESILEGALAADDTLAFAAGRAWWAVSRTGAAR